MSDAPSHPTGFGLVTREICSRLARRSHAIRILGWWGQPTAEPHGIEVVACPVSPAEASRVIADTLATFKPDVLVTLGDIPWVSYVARPAMRRLLDARRIPWCAHYPIDGCRADGTMPDFWAATLRQADLPIAMSEFGASVSVRSGIAAAHIPHGCDVDLFKPAADREAAKRAVGLGGRFVVLSDMRNHRRKLLPRLLDIFGTFSAGRPDAALLLNTNEQIEDDVDSYCYDLRADIAALGLSDRVRLPKATGSLAMQQLAALYAASDVHLLSSYGEGFGLPTLQAAAAGVVPIAGNHSANTELIAEHGLAVSSNGVVEDEFGLQRHFIDRDLAVRALDELYRNRRSLDERSRRSRDFALSYDWEALVPQWERQLSGAAIQADRPSPPAEEASAALRPTGHSAAVLPFPQLGIPVRPSRLIRATATLRVLADPPSARALQPLTALFPDVELEICTDLAELGLEALRQRLSRVILAADPFGTFGRRLAHACQDLQVCHIGRLEPYDPHALFALARRLLTDHSATQRRLAESSART